jgi:hypothetical protein
MPLKDTSPKRLLPLKLFTHSVSAPGIMLNTGYFVCVRACVGGGGGFSIPVNNILFRYESYVKFSSARKCQRKSHCTFPGDTVPRRHL